jgi:hypothetical protein
MSAPSLSIELLVVGILMEQGDADTIKGWFLGDNA